MKITTPGVYDMPETTYHADPCPTPSLSSTIAKTLLAQSPLHAWTKIRRLNPAWEPINKKTFDIGSAAHREVLGKGGDWIVIPEGILASNGAATTKEAKEFVANARAEGLTPIKADEAETVRHIAKKLHERMAEIGIALDPARSEMAAFAHIDGVWCRALVDNVPANSRLPLYDLKTTTDASPEAVTRTIMNYGYDVQAQHYREVWRAATGDMRPFRFIFVEKEPPYEICIVELCDDDLMMAERRIRRAREIFKNCLDRNDWPGYPLGVTQLKLPEYYQAKWLEQEALDAGIVEFSRAPRAAQMAGE